jgi:orotidine-5'-phosphate decarboxylase
MGQRRFEGVNVSTTFLSKLHEAQARSHSWVCVGLDPVLDRIPSPVRSAKNPLQAFCEAIVEATADIVSAYKPNLAFWLAEGPAGITALEQVIAAVPDHIPVILDAKFGDVGHTAAAYARAAYDFLGADAVTLSPYLGVDAVRPFLERPDRGIFLLARTSNPSAGQLQDLPAGGRPVYEQVARLATTWQTDYPGDCGLVVGATYPEELAQLRGLARDLLFLIPGVGAQGGSPEEAVRYGATASGIGPLINSSRGIIFASQGGDYAQAAREAALHLRDRINAYREGAQ